MKRSIFLAVVVCLIGTACSWVFPPSGPFEGRVVDAISGKPIAGAFVGITWSGRNLIHGGESCLHAVLVRTDAEGRYLIPWQGYKPVKLRAVGIGWGGKVWAPGYRMSRFGEGDPLTAGILDAARDPDVSINEGVERAKQRQAEGVDERTTVRLERAASTADALNWENRVYATEFDCGANIPEMRALAISLYRDSYQRICVEPLPAGPIDRGVLGQLTQDLEDIMTLYPEIKSWTGTTWLERYNFEKKINSAKINSELERPSTLDPSLLPEFCRFKKADAVLKEQLK